MKNEQLIQMVKFTLFSISAGVIQTASFTLFLEVFKMPYWPSYLIALILSVVWNFTVNRKYTFKSAANVPVAMAKVFGFYLVFTPLSTWLGDMAVAKGAFEYLVFFLTMCSNLVLEFLFCKFVVYWKQENNRVEQ